MQISDKIYVAGHNGMVGSAIVRQLQQQGFNNLVCRSSKELDLRNQAAVNDFFAKEQPQYVFLAAAKVGGIQANNNLRADFIYDNLMIEANIIYAAYEQKVTKLLFLGSSCIYPKNAPQPIVETALLTGVLEYTNQPYSIAKIAGIELCTSFRKQYGTNFISAMPTNLYGLNDNYNLENSHVLPALLRKFITAEKNNLPAVEIWGTGKPLREFLYVDDLAEACVFLMKNYNDAMPVNIGVGQDITIKDLALLIKSITGFKGEIFFNTEKPDGTYRKLLDVSKINQLGWKAKTNLSEGIKQVYHQIKDFNWQ